MAARTRLQLFAPDETVLRQGEPGDTMFVVLKGELSVRVAGPDGAHTEVARIEPDTFFGEMSLLTGAARSATVVAATACELLVIDHRSFEELLTGQPEFAKVISDKVAERQLGLDMKRSKEERERTIEQSSTHLLSKIRSFFGLGR
jgi:branched-chain amino acid transport system substrate-binding protein